MNKAMQELTDVSYNSGEQNKDMTQAGKLVAGGILRHF